MLLFILILIGIIFYYIAREVGGSPAPHFITYRNCPYFKEGRFQSPTPQPVDFNKIFINTKSTLSFYRNLVGVSPLGPKRPLPLETLNRESFDKIPADFAFYWFGHATLLMEVCGKRFLFDPVFGNAAPVPFMVRRYADAPIDVTQLPPIDVVVITHNHYDHLERKTVQALRNTHFVVPLGLGVTLCGWGIPSDHITELAWGESYQTMAVSITAETAAHFSGRCEKFRDLTACNSYVIQAPNQKIFVSGDTGYSPHFSEIARKYGAFDLAVLEIDGWNAAWPNSHLFPAQVIQAVTDLGATHLLPIHWATFTLGMHPWHESIDLVFEAAADSPVTILTPIIGERTTLDSYTKAWWKEVDAQ